MKYGHTLQQCSIPEWEACKSVPDPTSKRDMDGYLLGADNVDYNDIKHLIKLRTSKPKPSAIAIPGQNETGQQNDGFEEELYMELLSQHRRIDLFVHSKSGEIQRRLDHLQRLVHQSTRQLRTATPKRISVRRLDKYSRLENEILSAGEEIQSLARFVAAQRLAFIKLLKKYQKWTHSSRLSLRFRLHVLNRPETFAQKDFGALLSQWTDVLAAVRAPFEMGLTWQDGFYNTSTAVPGTEGATDSQFDNQAIDTATAARLHATCELGVEVDWDTTLATLPWGEKGGRACYWIHQDNLIQINILLQQHMKVLRAQSAALSRTASGLKLSRYGTDQGAVTPNYTDDEDETGTIFCGRLQAFSARRNAASSGDVETKPTEASALSIRYTGSSEASVTANFESESKQAKVNRKAWPTLFDNNGPSVNPSDLGPCPELKDIRNFLQRHQQIRPLMHLCYKRTRFVGLNNTKSYGLWASLDREIVMNKFSANGPGEQTIPATGCREKFPHAILEIRWEGQSSPHITKLLDASHLAERVPGFSLETHAVAVLWHPDDMATPSWLPTLERDIRKVPSGRRAGRRSPAVITSQSRQQASVSSAPDDHPPSVFSGVAMYARSSSTTSIPSQPTKSTTTRHKKMRRPRKAMVGCRKGLEAPPCPRYWNEFDEGEAAAANEAYTILVDPNASGLFSSLYDKLASWLRGSQRRPQDPKQAAIRRPTLSAEPSQRLLVEDPELAVSSTTTSEDETTDVPTTRPRHYSTFASNRRGYSAATRALRERDVALSRTIAICLVASLALLVLAAILGFTRRKRYVVTAQLGSLVGTILSGLLVVIALVLFAQRCKTNKRISWLHVGILGMSSAVLTFGDIVIGWIALESRRLARP